MSMHPSLKSSEKGKKARSVLKRIERLKTMLDKEQWKVGDRVYGLPKIKTIRIKIKKEKAEKAVEGATPVEGVAPAPAGGKPAAGAAKEAPAKKTEK